MKTGALYLFNALRVGPHIKADIKEHQRCLYDASFVTFFPAHPSPAARAGEHGAFCHLGNAVFLHIAAEVYQGCECVCVYVCVRKRERVCVCVCVCIARACM